MTGASPQARVRPGWWEAGLRLRLRAGVQPALMGERVGTQLGSRLGVWRPAEVPVRLRTVTRHWHLAAKRTRHRCPHSAQEEVKQSKTATGPFPGTGGDRGRLGERTGGRGSRPRAPAAPCCPARPGLHPPGTHGTVLREGHARRGRGVSGGLWSPAWSDFRGATAMTCAERPERRRGGGGHREQGPATDCVRRTDGPSRWREGQARSSGKAEGRKRGRRPSGDGNDSSPRPGRRERDAGDGGQRPRA